MRVKRLGSTSWPAKESASLKPIRSPGGNTSEPAENAMEGRSAGVTELETDRARDVRVSNSVPLSPLEPVEGGVGGGQR